MTAAELELSGAKEDAVVENTEIILYDMLIRMAQLMKVEEAISVLTQNLSEEKSMANWIKTNILLLLRVRTKHNNYDDKT